MSARRRCRGCNCELRRDEPGILCGPCEEQSGLDHYPTRADVDDWRAGRESAAEDLVDRAQEGEG